MRILEIDEDLLGRPLLCHMCSKCDRTHIDSSMVSLPLRHSLIHACVNLALHFGHLLLAVMPCLGHHMSAALLPPFAGELNGALQPLGGPPAFYV